MLSCSCSSLKEYESQLSDATNQNCHVKRLHMNKKKQRMQKTVWQGQLYKIQFLGKFIGSIIPRIQTEKVNRTV